MVVKHRADGKSAHRSVRSCIIRMPGPDFQSMWQVLFTSATPLSSLCPITLRFLCSRDAVCVCWTIVSLLTLTRRPPFNVRFAFAAARALVDLVSQSTSSLGLPSHVGAGPGIGGIGGEQAKIHDIKAAQARSALDHEQFFKGLEEASDGFGQVASYFGKGVML